MADTSRASQAALGIGVVGCAVSIDSWLSTQPFTIELTKRTIISALNTLTNNESTHKGEEA